MTTVRKILGGKGSRVLIIEKDATVYQAIERMAEHNVGSLVVMDSDDVVGIVTERDYLRDVALKGRSSKSTTISEIMSSQVIFAQPDDSIQICMAVMTEHRFRHLPVTGPDGLVGVVSLGDLVNQLLEDKIGEIQELRDYIQGRS
jgi:CBS domain-containing protein